MVPAEPVSEPPPLLDDDELDGPVLPLEVPAGDELALDDELEVDDELELPQPAATNTAQPRTTISVLRMSLPSR
jgi:hypothetical protein